MFDGPKSNFTETAAQRRIKSVEGKRNISIFGKLRAQATSSKFQTPSSKETPSFKLKCRPAHRLAFVFRVWCLEFLWSPHALRAPRSMKILFSEEQGIWCLVFRSALQSPEIKKKSRIAPAQW